MTTTPTEPPRNAFSPLRTTGITMAGMIPVGATIEDAWYSVAGHYGPHPEHHATLSQAVEDAVATIDARNRKAHAAQIHGYTYPEAFSIDLFWKIKYPATVSGMSGVTVSAERTSFDSLDQARIYLDRVNRYAHR